MDIVFGSSKLKKELSDEKSRIKRYGPRRAMLIQRRLDELRAAEVLEDLRHLPGPRCHELKANRKGQLSLDLDHPFRLILEPIDEPVPVKRDGGLDWEQVYAVRILEVVDTHG